MAGSERIDLTEALAAAAKAGFEFAEGEWESLGLGQSGSEAMGRRVIALAYVHRYLNRDTVHPRPYSYLQEARHIVIAVEDALAGREPRPNKYSFDIPEYGADSK